MKITELRCPACDGTLKIDEKNPNIAVCQYCKTSYVLEMEGDNAKLGKETYTQFYTPKALEPAKKTGWEPYGWKRGIACIGGALLIMAVYWGPKIAKRYSDSASRQSVSGIAAGIKSDLPAAEREDISLLQGLLKEGAELMFHQPADLLTGEQLSKVRWLEIRYTMDSVRLGYSMEDPCINPAATLSWLEFNRDSADLRMDALPAFSGLRKLRVSSNLNKQDLKGLELSSISCYCKSPAELANLLEKPDKIIELEILGGLESLDGLQQFPALERLSLSAGELTDIKELVNAKQVKFLTIENADEVSDFSVFSVMPWLEGLSVESEKLRDISFLASMPNLKNLKLADGSMLTLAGLEKNKGTLLELTIEDCDKLKDCSGIAALTNLSRLSLDLPYDCPEPDLSGLGGLTELSLEGFKSVSFLGGMNSLKSLTINSGAVDRSDVFANLTQLETLKCKFFVGSQLRMDFVEKLPALKTLDLTGGATYYDISGIFNMKGLETLLLNGMECEINFDRLKDNESLKTLKMDGIKLYKNVVTASDGAILYVDWDDVILSEHMDFLSHYPNLETLSLADNELTVLDFASGLGRLSYLNISGNYITDLKPLSELPALRQVIGTDNPIANDRVLGEKVQLIR